MFKKEVEQDPESTHPDKSKYNAKQEHAHKGSHHKQGHHGKAKHKGKHHANNDADDKKMSEFDKAQKLLDELFRPSQAPAKTE